MKAHLHNVDGLFFDMRFFNTYLIIGALLLACNQSEGVKGKSFVHHQLRPELSDSVKALLKEGDIILRRGDGPLSFHLSRSTGEPYTHCGIIFKGKNKWGVIHHLGRRCQFNRNRWCSGDEPRWFCQPVC